MLWATLPLAVLFWGGKGIAASRTFQVQVVTQPSSPNGQFTGQVVAANFDDPSPNPCYRKNDCYFAGFVNSKSWGEAGRAGYGTTDSVRVSERKLAAGEGRTMGDVARLLRDRGLLFVSMMDYLPAQYGRDPTFCIYVRDGQQVAGTLSSNCADAPVAPTSCELTPASVNFDWGEVKRSDSGYPELSRTLKVTCSRPTNIGLSVSGQSIPLNGNASTRAEFNLGSGWTGGTDRYVSDTASIEMKSRLIGLEDATGEYSGSAVMMFEQL
ncbi:hypothetical protein EKN38_25170 [Enterobacter sp. WCHEn045836]|uniref:hypothetical protein n=1 Tax=Enterobacter sp. WCHEn045836 TaxID=2497434 RepID=UPI000F83C098|nr:hypothetical protein [Enterobacter sp. WCHEn045836]RTP93720.1 hypothetical protein EKN38_25170 [Enterobacter sp. WCHEn045836]